MFHIISEKIKNTLNILESKYGNYKSIIDLFSRLIMEQGQDKRDSIAQKSHRT